MRKREPARGELVDVLPEIAPRLGIHARGRLVEQEQFRVVNETRREREALLPAAGKLARELFLPTGEPKLLDAFFHGLPTIRHGIHARDEIEVFRDAEVLVKN